jgi:Xaa-Pro aminopeptidase
VALRNGDVEHPYRADADVVWLTGFTEPDCVAVLSTEGDAPFTLFVRPKDKEREVWTGRRAGVEGALAGFCADRAFPLDALDAELPKLLQQPALFYRLGGSAPEFDARIARTLAALRPRRRTGVRVPARLEDPAQVLHELRLFKSPAELQALRRAVALTRDGHLAAMARARPGGHEYELQAVVEHAYRVGGGQGWGYPTIVAAGQNATVLHYNDNDGPLRDGDLVLIDSGAAVSHYSADVSRTFPVNGRFTAPQARAYDVVLEAADACIAAVRPGITIDALHDLAVRTLTRGMLSLGLLEGTEGDLDARIADSSYRRCYMHRTSHWLGLDVHDAGGYRDAQNVSRALEPGMVLTIEPGLYIAADDEKAPAELRGTGVRIEDDLLVTVDGAENLTREIPRERSEVERACRR